MSDNRLKNSEWQGVIVPVPQALPTEASYFAQFRGDEPQSYWIIRKKHGDQVVSEHRDFEWGREMLMDEPDDH